MRRRFFGGKSMEHLFKRVKKGAKRNKKNSGVKEDDLDFRQTLIQIEVVNLETYYIIVLR